MAAVKFYYTWQLQLHASWAGSCGQNLKKLEIYDIIKEKEVKIMTPIKGYENYSVDIDGRIYNTKTGRALKPSQSANGYYRVSLRKNGKTKTVYVHRIVAETFIKNPNGYIEVNHIDENKANNAVDNLQWIDHKANINHATCQQRKGESNTARNGKPILCVETNTIYQSATIIEKEFGYNKGNIWQACNGKIPTAYGFHWQYVEKE
jgi:hypothetical protein